MTSSEKTNKAGLTYSYNQGWVCRGLTSHSIHYGSFREWLITNTPQCTQSYLSTAIIDRCASLVAITIQSHVQSLTTAWTRPWNYSSIWWRAAFSNKTMRIYMLTELQITTADTDMNVLKQILKFLNCGLKNAVSGSCRLCQQAKHSSQTQHLIFIMWQMISDFQHRRKPYMLTLTMILSSSSSQHYNNN